MAKNSSASKLVQVKFSYPEVIEILGLKANNKHNCASGRRYGKFVALKDMQNLKTKVREEKRMGWDASLTLDKLTDPLQAHQGAPGGVVVH